MPSLPFTPPDGAMHGLRLVDVLEGWDIPLLVAAEDDSGAMYLAVLVGEDTEADTWLLARCSTTTMFSVASGVTEYRDAFATATESFTVRFDHGTGQSALESLDAVPAEWLPAAGYAHAGRLDSEVSLANLDIEGVWAKVRLEPADLLGMHEFPVRQLGNVLRSIQSMVEAAASGLAGHRGSRGSFPEAITRGVRLNARAFMPSSFGIVLVHAQDGLAQRNLLPETEPLRNSLTAIIELMNAGTDEDHLGQLVQSVGPRFVTHYQTLLTNLRTVGSGLELEWLADRASRGRARISYERISDLVKALSQATEDSAEVIEVYGELTTFSLDKRRFTLATDDEAQQISGPLSDSLRPETMVVGVEYVARIRVVTRVNPVTLDERVEYRLLELSPSA